MNSSSRLAAIAIVAFVAVGAAFVFSRPSASGADSGIASPSPSPSPQSTAQGEPSAAPGITVAAFKMARDAICDQGATAKAPLKVRILRIFDPAASVEERADGLVALDAFITLDAGVIDQLAALEAPADIRDGHVANVTQFQDNLTLIRRISSLLHAGDVTSAEAVDASTDDFNQQISTWEQSYNFNNCP